MIDLSYLDRERVARETDLARKLEKALKSNQALYKRKRILLDEDPTVFVTLPRTAETKPQKGIPYDGTFELVRQGQ